MSEGVPGAFARPHGLDTLELDSGHGALGHGGALLQVLEDQLAAGSADGLSPVGLGVVRQTSSVGNALNHLEKKTNEKFKLTQFGHFNSSCLHYNDLNTGCKK